MLNFIAGLLLISECASILPGCRLAHEQSATDHIAVPMQTVAVFFVEYLPEPSGIVFHPLRGTLFAVSDEGTVCELSTDGVKRNLRTIRQADFEGITVHPATGKLYVAVEGEEKILEIDPDMLIVDREFVIDRAFNETIVLDQGGNGIEAITYIPGERVTEPGIYVIANQCFSTGNLQDPSALYELTLPSHTSSIVHIAEFIPMNITDISGLQYDPKTGNLVIISDSNNRICEYSRAGRLIRSHHLPGKNQEGIAIDADGYIYIAQDSGGILKCKRFPVKK